MGVTVNTLLSFFRKDSTAYRNRIWRDCPEELNRRVLRNVCKSLFGFGLASREWVGF